MRRRKRSSLFAARRNPVATAPAPAEELHRAVLLEDGKRIGGDAGEDLPTLLAAARTSPERTVVAWYDRPGPAEIAELARTLDLHPLLVEDIEVGHQRPKLERYGETLFIVVHTARYLEEPEAVVHGEIHLLLTHNCVVIIRNIADDANPWHPAELHENSALLHLGGEGVLYAVLDQIVDGYLPVLEGVGNDIDEIERQVFSGDPAAPERIYRLSREVIDLQDATRPMADILTGLQRGFMKYGTDEDLQTYLTDVSDHLAQVNNRTREFRDLLAQILSVNVTLVGQRQNEDMKKISSWAAILFAPTLVGAIYGMNFDVMPELHWAFGYPMALGLMGAMALVLYLVFKRNKWL